MGASMSRGKLGLAPLRLTPSPPRAPSLGMPWWELACNSPALCSSDHVVLFGLWGEPNTGPIPGWIVKGMDVRGECCRTGLAPYPPGRVMRGEGVQDEGRFGRRSQPGTSRSGPSFAGLTVNEFATRTSSYELRRSNFAGAACCFSVSAWRALSSLAASCRARAAPRACDSLSWELVCGSAIFVSASKEEGTFGSEEMSRCGEGFLDFWMVATSFLLLSVRAGAVASKSSPPWGEDGGLASGLT